MGESCHLAMAIINFGVLGLVATAVAGFASGEPGGYKSFKGWPSDASLMSSHTSPCDIKSYKAKLLAGEGYYFDSGTAAGWCRTIPVKNVPKVRAAHAHAAQWSGSDHATGKTYLPRMASCGERLQTHKKVDVSASARCSSVVAGMEPGTLNCNPSQESCSTVEVPHTEPGPHSNLYQRWCEYAPDPVHCRRVTGKSYCREAFDPVHKAKVECPDGIGPAGYFMAGAKNEHGAWFEGACVKWEKAPTGKTQCDHIDPKLAKSCTKTKVTHMLGYTSRSQGALLFKRNVCVGDRCAEWKTGRCIDVGEVVWNCNNMPHGMCAFGVNNAKQGRKKFARLAVRAMKTYEAHLTAARANKTAGQPVLPWKYACGADVELILKQELRMF